MQDQIEQLSKLLKSEKETRETWVSRYEKEKKDSSDFAGEILNLKSQIQDLELSHNSLKVQHDTQVSASESA